jgi:hypothetical protein
MADGWKWSWNEPGNLHHYVLEGVRHELGRIGARKSPLEYVDQRDFEGLVREIYEALRLRDIRYDHDPPGGRGGPYAGSQFQELRTPYEVLRTTNQATCIDLSLLFCGLCLDYNLVPLLVLLDGHAFAAVSLEYTRTEYKLNNPKGPLLELRDRFNPNDRLFKDVREFSRNKYLPVECTGFAYWKPLDPDGGFPEACRDTTGYLSFDEAVRAGDAHLQLEAGGRPGTRKVICILNIAHSRDVWKISADQAGSLPERTAVYKVPPSLRSLVDREPFATRIKNVVEVSGRGPHVLILHGDRDQAHEEFIQRVAVWVLPGLFKTPKLVVRKLQPPLSPSHDADAFMLRQLAPLWNREEHEGWDSLLSQIKEEAPQILQFNFLFGEEGPSQRLGFEAVCRTLDYWRDWARRRAPGVADRMIILLSVAYDPSDNLTGFSSVKRLFKRPRGSGIRPKVERLKIDDYKQSLNLDRLEALTGVSWNDLDEWIDRHEVSRYFGEALPALRHRVDQALRNECVRHRQSLPMKNVINTLAELAIDVSGGSLP